MNKEYPEETSILELTENWEKDTMTDKINVDEYEFDTKDYVKGGNVMLISVDEYNKLKAMQERVEDIPDILMRASKDYEGMAKTLHEKGLIDVFEKTFTELAGTAKFLEMEAEAIQKFIKGE